MKERTPQAGVSERPRGRRSWLARSLALLVVLLAVGAGVFVRYAGVLAAVAPGVTARNGSMEDLFVGGVAFGWDNNSWGDAVVSFAREEEKSRSGRMAQRVRLERVTKGAAQLRQMGIALHAGQPYTLTVWLRGTVEGPVFVGVRQNEAPYKRYLVQNVRVAPEWRRYVITGTPDEAGPSAGIYIAFSSPGELWIDDVELQEGAPAADPARIASVQPERKGNLLYNSGFELGADGWGPVARVRAETTGAAQGRTCARCTADWEAILLESRPVVVRPGQRHTVSASLKAGGPAEVELVVMEYADEGGDRPGQRDAIRQTFKINQKWQRVSLTGVLQAPLVSGYVLQINLRSGSGPVWADAIQWEEGTLTSYKPAAPVEVAARASSRFLKPGQPAVTECRIYRAPAAPSVAVSCRLEDSDGRLVEERKLSGSTAKTTAALKKPPTPNPIETVQQTWKAAKPGIYRVVAGPAGTPVNRTGQAVFCMFPGGRAASLSPRIGVHGWSNPATPNSAVQAAAFLGAGGFRLHDFRSFIQWYEVEPEPGRYVWYDRDIADLERRGFGLIGTLCRTPLWAGRDGEGHQRHRNWTSSPPRDWEAWDRYVTAVVSHYRGKIRAWEVWNEPWGKNFWTGSPGEYVQMLARTQRTIKTADPHALVIGGCFSPEFPQFTHAALRAGALNSMDVVSYHEYLSPAKVAEPADGGDPSFYRGPAALREEIRRRGGQQPVWCTETGIHCPSFYSWLPKEGPRFSGQVAAAALVKGLTLQLAAGVERIYYYQIGGVEWGQGYPSRLLNSAYTLLDFDGSPKPTLPAMAQAIAMLGDAAEPADLSGGALRAYLFRREGVEKGGRFVVVAWARGAEPVPVELTGSASITAFDLMGAAVPAPVRLGSRPIYLLADSREALARALGAAKGGLASAR
jgi:hypothetical protein